MKIPGFIDLQVNGYAGIDINDPATSPDKIIELSEILAEKGTAAFLGTIYTAPKEAMEQCVENVALAIQKQEKPGRILGIHLEGPFISAEEGYRGAHPKNAICAADLPWFRKLQKISHNTIRIVTLAPEQKNVLNFIRTFSPEVLISVGHSNCNYETLRKAVDAGLKIATHIGNACAHTVDRHDNPIVRILAQPELPLCFIADGLHLPQAFIRMLINARPTEKLIVVSDSVAVGGLKPGNYRVSNGMEVILEKNGRITLASNPNLMAGSSATMLQCMNHMASLNLLTYYELFNIGYSNPLKLLNSDVTTSNRVIYNQFENRFDLL